MRWLEFRPGSFFPLTKRTSWFRLPDRERPRNVSGRTEPRAGAFAHPGDHGRAVHFFATTQPTCVHTILFDQMRQSISLLWRPVTGSNVLMSVSISSILLWDATSPATQWDNCGTKGQWRSNSRCATQRCCLNPPSCALAASLWSKHPPADPRSPKAFRGDLDVSVRPDAAVLVPFPATAAAWCDTASARARPPSTRRPSDLAHHPTPCGLALAI